MDEAMCTESVFNLLCVFFSGKKTPSDQQGVITTPFIRSRLHVSLCVIYIFLVPFPRPLCRLYTYLHSQFYQTNLIFQINDKEMKALINTLSTRSTITRRLCNVRYVTFWIWISLIRYNDFVSNRHNFLIQSYVEEKVSCYDLTILLVIERRVDSADGRK